MRRVGKGPVAAEEAIGEVEGCFDVAWGGGGPETHRLGEIVRWSRRGKEVGIASSKLGAESEC